jgi:hypothetical protein
MYSKIQATAIKFADSYRLAFSTKNASILSSSLSPDCTRHIAPTSFLATLGLENRPISNAEYEAIVQTEFPAFASNQVTIQRMAIDEGQKSAFLLAELKCVLQNGKEYSLEFVFLLDMTESCEKVRAITQFLDTAKCTEARGLIHEILSSQRN